MQTTEARAWLINPILHSQQVYRRQPIALSFPQCPFWPSCRKKNLCPTSTSILEESPYWTADERLPTATASTQTSRYRLG